MAGPPLNIHGTVLAWDGEAVLLRGKSGSGKSDLAWRTLLADEEVRLVADDRVDVTAGHDGLMVCAPAALAGLLEIRGLGLLELPYTPQADLRLIVDLVPIGEVPRMVPPAFEEMAGVLLPRLALHAFEPSAPAKLALALRAIGRRGFPGPDGRLED
ncbi:HPr kinase/phosphorylase [Tepidicaulis sp. LMO-SS28]|uniref:HPr kinase/phosphorylase n=1 Tax=Tepidicaulis sp. LMO-SS28 TaxID=3447455 RepID=UPI003EE2F8E3